MTIQKSMALQVFGAAVCSGMGIVDACKLSSLATGFNHKVIHRWAQHIFVDFFSSKSSLEDVTDQLLDNELESERGKHPKWISLSSDENFQVDVRKFVCEKAYVRGSPNRTLNDVATWIKATYQVEVCTSTMSNWLHNLGFGYHQYSKGVYFDGHERADVVADRRVYLKSLQSLDSRMWPYHCPSPDPAIRPVIRILSR